MTFETNRPRQEARSASFFRPMDQIELLQHLVGFGYPHKAFSVLGVGTARNEGFVLETLGSNKWRIAFFERGAFVHDVELFDSEEEACRRYLERIQREEIVLVMRSSSSEVQALRRHLHCNGISGQVHSIGASVFGIEMHQLVVNVSQYARALSLVCFDEPRREVHGESGLKRRLQKWIAFVKGSRNEEP